MPSSNGKHPQHHLTTTEIVARALERRTKPFHWPALDMDVLIRPRTTAENAAIVDESTALARDAEQYEGTPDAPGSIEGYRLRLRAALPCILYPDDRTPVFDHESVEQLLELDTPALNELLDEVDGISNFSKVDAETAAKNSVGEIEDDKPSSISPVAPETSTSSPTPTPSAG